MSKYATLIAQIAANIRRNGAQAITGDLLQEQLLAMITSLGEYYQFGGLASPSAEFTPGDEPVVFVAATPGAYTNFGGLVVADGEVALLVWSGSAWSKQTTDIATRSEVSQLGQELALGENIHIGTYVAAFEEENYHVTDTSASVKATRVIPNQRIKVYVKSDTLSYFAVYAYPPSSSTLIKEIPNGTDFSNGVEFEFTCPAEMEKDQYGVTKILFRTFTECILEKFDCWRLEPNNSTAFDDVYNRLSSQETLNTVQSTSAIYEMIIGEAFRFSQIQYDSDGKVTSANINWGDGANGVMTINYDSSGVVTYIDYTKGTGGLGNTGTYRQSFVYYSDGNIQGNQITKIA